MKILRWFISLLFFLADVLVIFAVWFLCVITVQPPAVADSKIEKAERIQLAPDFYRLNHSWIKKNEAGLWEMYVEGNGYQRGITEGKLNKELAEQQEIAFVDQIRKMIPSEGILNYLKYFIAFFNRHLDQYITQEYKEEIYGESKYASPKFNFIAPPYYRMLNYHAAHDIGHALQDKNMLVGCTSFGCWGGKTKDHGMLIGRNFDFYVGDEFAVNKIVNFVKPDSGNKFMMVTWAGMIGAVSGMNEKGLTVTINASKSEIPTSSATPISLVAREILQYAGNLNEALAIAKKRKTFVSESILVGSAADHTTAIIQKTPSQTSFYSSDEKDYIVCANHFQGKDFQDDPVNIKNIAESSSDYRFRHLKQLIDRDDTLTASGVAAILRNRRGMDETDIGMGNEKSLNQLIAHHAVIFEPEKQLVWVSTNPFQLGQFICYDLKKVFALAPQLSTKKAINEMDLTIAADPFVNSAEFRCFGAYKEMRAVFHFEHKHNLLLHLTPAVEDAFIACNPHFYETYVLLADHYRDAGDSPKAMDYYRKALTKEITTKQDEDYVRGELKKLEMPAIK